MRACTCGDGYDCSWVSDGVGGYRPGIRWLYESLDAFGAFYCFITDEDLLP